jgi:predicted RNA-binding protein with PIN domain
LFVISGWKGLCVPLLIDGYNLLHVTGLFGRGVRGSLEASRTALLNFLVAALEPRERTGTTIIFDASDAPPGLPDRYSHHGVAVRFAREYDSADEMLEELIAAHHSPKRLTVVSSDHRVQRAATKRRATAVDSHRWYADAAERLNARKKRFARAEIPDVKPDVALTQGEVEYWVKLFGPVDLDIELDSPAEDPPAKRHKPAAKSRRAAVNNKPTGTTKADAPIDEKPRKKAAPPSSTRKRAAQPNPKRAPKPHGRPKDLGFGDMRNPFPPGYGEDLEES